MLRLEDAWIWDSWIADDGELYHLFFLKAPRALRDPALRHTAARVGHATSSDLVDWTLHEDALAPVAGRWDDLAIWTGSVQQGDDGVWRFYYSALSTSGGHGTEDQRIGVAQSDDLCSWRRAADTPLVAPDSRWYRTLAGASERSCTWRDPFVFPDPEGAGWHMLITARATGVPLMTSGVLAHARSADMLAWELQPPLSRPAGFSELEVAQVRMVEGRPLLVFTCQPSARPMSRCRDMAPSAPGTYSATRSPAPGTYVRHCLLKPSRSYRRLHWCNGATAVGPFWDSAARSCRARRRWRSSIRYR
ncbi:MAG: glycosyl hydrolase family 32 [Solirubrobacteraceae bacterium]